MAGLLIALGILAIILLLRLSLTVRYGEGGLRVHAWLGPVRLTLYPRKEKREKPEKREKEKRKKEEPPEPEERGGGVERFRAALELVGPVMGRIRRRLLIRRLVLHYTAATEDAAMTAMAYGGANAAVALLLPMIRYNFRVKAQDIQIDVEFDSSEPRVFARVEFSLAVWEALCLIVSVGLLVLRSGLLGKRRDGQEQVPQTGA